MKKMSSVEIEFYEAGIKDANEKRHIVIPCRSERFLELERKYKFGMKQAIRCLDAYGAGVAHEINRQTFLEFKKEVN